MTRLASLAEISSLAAAGRDQSSVERLLRDADENKRTLGILIRSAALFEKGSLHAALNVLLSARSRLGFAPLAVISNTLDLCGKLGLEQTAAHECLAFGRDALAMGCDDLGLEACMAALVLDSLGQFDIIRDPASLRSVAELYDGVASRVSAGAKLQRANKSGRKRVAIIVPNLVDDIVANTKTALDLVRHIEKDKFETIVYSTENLSVRDNPMFPFGCTGGHSEERGKRSVETILSLGGKVHICSRAAGFVAAAKDLAGRLADEGVDIIILQSGLACPIDWLAVKLAPSPVKMSVHTGTSMFMPGMDLNFYDNPVNIERESPVWKAEFGERIALAQGVNIEELRGQPALSRAALGVPESATIIGLMSNHLEERLSERYLLVVSRIMERDSNVWFLAFGAGAVPHAENFFRSKGLAGRARFGGRQSAAGSALKALDIYASEFPVGGSQSVIEAMACGTPVAALKWSDAHAESAAAAAVGPEFAIPGPDLDSYEETILDWIRDPIRRAEVGRKMARRAELNYSARTYALELTRRAEETLERKGCHEPKS